MKATNERQLKLFAAEAVELRSSRESQAFSKFMLAGRVREMDTLRKAQRRYRYHRQLRRHGIPVDGPNRTIDVSGFASFQDIPVPARWYVGQLIKRGYNAVFKIIGT